MNYKKKISQKGGFLNFLHPIARAALPLMTNILTKIAKNVLLPLGVTAAVPATDANL